MLFQGQVRGALEGHFQVMGVIPVLNELRRSPEERTRKLERPWLMIQD